MARTTKYDQQVVGPRFTRWAGSVRKLAGVTDYKLAQVLEKGKGSGKLTDDALPDRQTQRHLRGERVPSIGTIAGYGKAFRQLGVAWVSEEAALFISGCVPEAAERCAIAGDFVSFGIGSLAYIFECEQPLDELIVLLDIDTKEAEKHIALFRDSLAKTSLKHDSLLKKDVIPKRAIMDYVESLRPNLYDRTKNLCSELELIKSNAISLILKLRDEAGFTCPFSSYRAKKIIELYMRKRSHYSNHRIYRDFGDNWLIPEIVKCFVSREDSDLAKSAKYVMRLYEHNLTLLEIFSLREIVEDEQ